MLLLAKVVMVLAILATIAIRAPHGRRYRELKVKRQFKTELDSVLLMFVMLGFLLPVVWAIWSVFSFADYPPRIALLVAGTACLVSGLWLFYRSHADLGRNWSVTLEVRDLHELITQGVYQRIRHPMYTSLCLYAIGQALVVPNWFVGLADLVPFTILCAVRLTTEEKMMLETFGADYAAYKAKTKRMIPGVW
jgi:protein-S-isoprenylcysteine O-methyltransferase Ste14